MKSTNTSEGTLRIWFDPLKYPEALNPQAVAKKERDKEYRRLLKVVGASRLRRFQCQHPTVAKSGRPEDTTLRDIFYLEVLS